MSKKGRIALLTGQADETYQSDFVKGVMKRAFEAGYDVCVFSMFIKYQASKEREVGDSNIFNLINYDMFDAVILMSDSIQTPGVEKKIEERIHKEFDGPVICVDIESPYFKSFWTDGYQGIYAIVSHLIEAHGYKDIVFLSGRSFHRHSKRRADAYRDALKDHGMSVDEENISWGDFWYTGGAAFAENLLHNREKLPEAVACANDPMAIGLAEALERNGIRVPEDIAITGYGTFEEGQYAPKSLTSFYLPGESYGIFAVEAILNMMDGKDIGEPDVDVKLFVGESCGCKETTPVSIKRDTWTTNESEAGFYSLHNTMQGDLLRCESAESFMAETCENMYYLKGIDRLDICLNEGWVSRDIPELSIFPTDSYSDKMVWAINYEFHRPEEGQIGLDKLFARKDLLPGMETDNPTGYIFVPLNFGQYSFGYSAISFGSRPNSYTEVFRLWCQALSRALEGLRRTLQMQVLEKRLLLPSGDKGAVIDPVNDEELMLVKEILDNNLFTYHFQPIVNAKDGSIYAYEALMRSATEKRISPLAIINAAETLGRISDIERYTFLNVLKIFEDKKDLFKNRKVFINSIPGCRLDEADSNHVREKITMQDGNVVIELTESAELDDNDLDRIKKGFEEIGAGFAIDDYGTGYSNVSNLLRYMPNVVKIDRSLLANIQESPQKEHFVRDIIEFCHDNDIMALAEGIETSGELKCVMRLGADLIQGYYTARPNAEILDEIDSEIKEEIIKINKEIEEGGDSRFYAGRTTRVSISQLLREHFNTIVIGSKDVKFKNITIVGVPGREQAMEIEILDGYKGQVILENVTLMSMRNHPCIRIGEDCNVGIKLMGGNRMKNGGIRVPESSKLNIEGDGSLIIECGGDNCFGIGNGGKEKHGEIESFLDGDITMELSGSNTAGIGGGAGGRISLHKGKYVFVINSDSAVAVGSVSGVTKVSLETCHVESRILTKKAVALGSLYGDVLAYMHNCSLHTRITSHQAVVVGSLEGLDVKYEASDMAIKADVKANIGSCVAALCGKTYVQVDDATVDYTAFGTELYGLGGMNEDTGGELVSCDINADIHSPNGAVIKAPIENLHIVDGRFNAEVHGD